MAIKKGKKSKSNDETSEETSEETTSKLGKSKAKVKKEKTKEKGKDKVVKAKKEKKPAAEKNEVGIRKGTVLETIYNCLNTKKGSTKQEIIERCTKDHPDRDPEKMANTVQLQLSRMPKEREFELNKDDKGRYKVAEAS